MESCRFVWKGITVGASMHFIRMNFILVGISTPIRNGSGDALITGNGC